MSKRFALCRTIKNSTNEIPHTTAIVRNASAYVTFAVKSKKRMPNSVNPKVCPLKLRFKKRNCSEKSVNLSAN